MKKLLLALLIIATACNSVKNKKNNSNSLPEDWMKDNIKSKQIVVLKVNAEEIECYGAQGKQKCLQIKELGKDNYWQNQYEGIEGFDFKPGFVYNLQVEKIVLKNPPQDVGDTFYKLLKVIKTAKPITDAMMSDYATLTVTKIQQGRDGYTATLKNDAGSLYVCTISIPNLEDNFITLNIGDKVKIAGEYAESDPVQIFAKKYKSNRRRFTKTLTKTYGNQN